MAGLDEFGLIAELFAPLSAGCPGAFGLKDDAAVVSSPAGMAAVLTMDAVVAGVHFLPDDPPDLVARKLVRVNLSDLAAMGAQPYGLLLAAAFPRGADEGWLRAFGRGLAEDVAGFGLCLLGGDTVATPGPATFSLTAMGWCVPGRELRRNGARAGDLLAVSGTIGDSALGLKVLRGGLSLPSEHSAFLVDRYRLPQPRVALGPALVGIAGAAMDVSDGLCADLGHICRASGVGAVVEAAKVPLSEAARAAVGAEPALIASILGGGDDYELLFTVPPGRWPEAEAAARAAGVPVTAIGRIVEGTDVSVLDAAGTPLVAQGGWRHF